VTVKVYVEGGGDHNEDLRTRCRKGFSQFLERAGFKGRMPRIVACGGRKSAFDFFKKSHEDARENELAILLVDSETPFRQESPWDHVQDREGDGWDRPTSATDEQLHLMVQAMEAWFYADKEAVERYYQRGFRMAGLGRRADIENISTADLFAGLERATKDCQKGGYSKGEHSFGILGMIDPQRVRTASPQADRLLVFLDSIL
jgi:hypothetical protein